MRAHEHLREKFDVPVAGSPVRVAGGSFLKVGLNVGVVLVRGGLVA